MLRSLRPVYILGALGALVFIGVKVAMLLAPGFLLSPPASFGAPLRAGNRIFLLTGQWKTRIELSDLGSSTDDATDLFVDVWAFDALTAKPVYRRRVQTIRNGAMMDRSVLGAQGKNFWVLLPDGPYAVEMETGKLVASAESLSRLNPGLRGLLPTAARFYSFTTTGLSVKAADARTWHIHPETFLATDQPAAGLPPGILPAHFTPQATHAFLVRGLSMSSRWVGLLNAAEAKSFEHDHGIGDLDYQTRRALYIADIKPVPTFFGPSPRYSNFRAITEEFLAPGILSEHRSQGPHAPILRRDPDSVFLLHLDRLGEDGKLLLTRVAGPGGKILWQSPLPLSVLQSVMNAGDSLVMYGRLFRKQDPNASVRSDPMHSARELLVVVDWATGAVSYHDQSDLAKHPEATPAQ